MWRLCRHQEITVVLKVDKVSVCITKPTDLFKPDDNKHAAEKLIETAYLLSGKGVKRTTLNKS